jgi:hypothetical protein
MRKLIEDCLREGRAVEIDGRGTLELDGNGQLVFRRNARLSVFVAYAEQDRPAVKRLYDGLRAAGFEPWMDQEKLLPGQNWPLAIERAIDMADYFVGCFSVESAYKRGYFQTELNCALDLARRLPAEDAFLIPVRLNNSKIPELISRKIHYVDLYPDFDAGVKKLTRALRKLQKKRSSNES